MVEVASVMDDPRIDLMGSKLQRVDELLSKLWTTQIVLVLLAILTVFGATDMTKVAAKFLLDADVVLAPRLLAGILAAVLLYSFIRFGFVAGQFLVTRAACDCLLPDESSLAPADRSPTYTLFETTNFFEPLHQSPTFVRRGHAALVVMGGTVAIVIAASLNSTIALIHMALGPTPLATGFSLLAAALYLGCYLQMATSEVGHSTAARVILTLAAVCSALGAICIFPLGRG